MAEPTDDDDCGAEPKRRSARIFAQALSACLNVTALFAAPRAFDRWSSSFNPRERRVSKEDMVKELDALADLFLAELDVLATATMHGDRISLQGVPILLSELRTLIDAWDAESRPGPELVAKARAMLSAIGMPVPPGGWDDYLPE